MIVLIDLSYFFYSGLWFNLKERRTDGWKSSILKYRAFFVLLILLNEKKKHNGKA